MKHVVLLGDSVFDNGAYVGIAPDVRKQLQTNLPGASKATLLARDGATVSEIRTPLMRIPSDATHLVISAGGNDALRLPACRSLVALALPLATPD